MKTTLIKSSQPNLNFYVSALPATSIMKFAKIARKSENVAEEDEDKKKAFIQRNENKNRIKEITHFTYNPDAIFPTSIIIAIDLSQSSDYKFFGDLDNDKVIDFEFNENKLVGYILDGQHRMLGLEESSVKSRFDLPVVFVFNVEPSDMAYIFNIVNGTQVKVPSSHTYDLYDYINEYTPQKVAHELAYAFNNDSDSPFFNRIKMLGTKEEGSLQYLSQGTFVDYILLNLISKNPLKDTNVIKQEGLNKLEDDDRTPLRKYFLENRTDVIYKILYNYFSAIQNVFNREWNDPESSNITKAIGFGGLIKAFPYIFNIAETNGKATENFFKSKFENVSRFFESKHIAFNSRCFVSGSSEENRLRDLIIEGFEFEK